MDSIGLVTMRGARAASTVCAVTVTYGERLHLLAVTLRGAVEAGVGAAIVVGNGISQAYASAIARLRKELSIPIIIVLLPENRGSASGFAAALREAMAQTECPFFWLLDDDNRPAPDALAALRSTYETISGYSPETCALSSLRQDRPHYRKAAAGGGAAAAFPPRCHVMGFDWRRAALELLHRLRGAREAGPAGPAATVPIPWAPYGGLFLHRRMLETIGYPDEALRLYGDDTEFTNRIVRRGGHLFLVPSSRIADIEPSWTEGGGRRRFFIARMLSGGSPRRLYLSIRNDVFFTSRYWCDSHPRMVLNAVGFAVLAVATGLAIGRLRAALLACRALRDGLAGRLDRNVPAL